MVPCSLRPESLKKKYNTNEPSGVSQRRRVWFLDWNESGLRPDPGPDVMLLRITLRRLLRKSREPALARMPHQSANLRRSI